MFKTTLIPFRAAPISAALAASLLASCGGGGSSPTPTPGPVAVAPTITSSPTATIVENSGGSFFTATATASVGSQITWSIVAGGDADKFAIDAGGALSFRAAPNFDLPTDDNRDNVYVVTIRAQNAAGLSSQAVSVTVTNDKEGIAVRRVGSGFVDPVAISATFNGEELMIAERGGRVVYLNPVSGTVTEDTFVRDAKQPGEVLAAIYSALGGPNYNEGPILISHSDADGLAFQGFDQLGRGSQYLVIGDRWPERVVASMFRVGSGRQIMFAVGDPTGLLSQDTTSAYGKLFSVTPFDPYAGASLPAAGTRRYGTELIGDGIRQPGGGGTFFGETVLTDQGADTAHGLFRFNGSARPLDFGAPFYEGATVVRSPAPVRVNGPIIAYDFGTGFGQGTGIVAGYESGGSSISGLSDQYLFGDRSGKVWTIPIDILREGFLRSGADLEDRSLDFEPDVGAIDSILAFEATATAFYILDADGDVFVVESQ